MRKHRMFPGWRRRSVRLRRRVSSESSRPSLDRRIRRRDFVEARGEVVKVLWQNPHIRLEISTARFDGVSELWLLEGQNPTNLDRARIPRNIVKVGDR